MAEGRGKRRRGLGGTTKTHLPPLRRHAGAVTSSHTNTHIHTTSTLTLSSLSSPLKCAFGWVCYKSVLQSLNKPGRGTVQSK